MRLPVKPRSSVITRSPSRRCCHTDSARGRTVSNPVGMPSAGPRVRTSFSPYSPGVRHASSAASMSARQAASSNGMSSAAADRCIRARWAGSLSTELRPAASVRIRQPSKHPSPRSMPLSSARTTARSGSTSPSPRTPRTRTVTGHRVEESRTTARRSVARLRFDVMPVDSDLATRLRARGLRMTAEARAGAGRRAPARACDPGTDQRGRARRRPHHGLPHAGAARGDRPRAPHPPRPRRAVLPAGRGRAHPRGVPRLRTRWWTLRRDWSTRWPRRLARRAGFVLDRSHFTVFGRCRIARRAPTDPSNTVHDHARPAR